MTPHPNELELVELAAGRLAGPDALRCREHLAACEACRDLYESQVRIWRAMDAYVVADPPADLPQRILQAAEAQRHAPIRLPGIGRWTPWLRVAAMLLVSVGIGHVAGRQFRQAPTPPAGDVEVLAADALYLDELGGQTAWDWTQTILEGEVTEESEVRG